MWVLVFMVCQRVCVPMYAEVFPDKAACVAVVDTDKSWLHVPRSYCVPVVKQ